MSTNHKNSGLLLDTKDQVWAYLNRVVEGPSHHLARLLEEHTADKIAYGIYHREEWIGQLLVQTQSRYDWLRQEEDLAAARAVGARLITPDDAEWPHHEFSSSFGFYAAGMGQAPAAFDADACAPHSLWVRGAPLAGQVQQAVAMVGTRAMSRYGFEATRMLTQGLVSHQWTIVSGGALGVDTAAHETALNSGGATVAVLACGINVPYPARNATLFDRIAASGTVVSEYPPDTTPQRHRFLTRNRLVAALSAGTVMVEAAFRSGALNTMNWAEALGRVTMAVPGPILNASSIGCHCRIKEGRAQLVTSVDDIRELISALGTVDAEAQLELDFSKSVTQQLSRNELKVYGSTPLADAAFASNNPPPPGAEQETPGAKAEAIAREAGMKVPLVVHLLVDLEKRGLVHRSGAHWFRVDERPSW